METNTMKVFIEKVIWHLSKDMKEGTVTFSINGVSYNAFSFNNDFKAGLVFDVEFSHISDEITWEEKFNNNPEKKMCLVRTDEWSYYGYGKIVSIKPVIADFGHITLDLGDWTNDERVIGEYIFWKILRLDIWPKNKESNIK